jgi:hypothetical protein
MAVSPELATALADVAARMRGAERPWWIVGSAAVALHGAQTSVADIDLLTDAATARAVLASAGLPARPGAGSRLFRSEVFGTIAAGPLPVEVMGALWLGEEGGWRRVSLVTRQPVEVGGATLWVPDRAELVALLRRFGRAKDLARAALLEALPPA